MDADAYARQLKALFPRGRLWSLGPGSVLSTLLLGIAAEPARVDARGDAVVDEWDPSTAEETLSDWERVLGLPKDGQALPVADVDRRASVVQNYLATGGATPAYFIAVALRLGFWVTIDEGPAGELTAYQWRMNVSADATTIDLARIGCRIGDRLSGRSNTALENVINRLKPAHTRVFFVYLGVGPHY